MPLQKIVAAVERVGLGIDGISDIRLYTAWIADNHGAPDLFAAWFNLGVALVRSGDRIAAVQAYSNALALKPDFHPASINLGLSLEALGHKDQALRTWRDALQSNDARVALLNQRARLLESLGRLSEAEDLLRTSLTTCPNQPDAAQHWIHLRQKLCAWPVLEALPGLPTTELLRMSGPLSALALTDDVQSQTQASAGWIERKTYAVPGWLSPTNGYQHEKLRIGYLSSDFCRHAMSFLITELFERHDRAQFEVYGYCSSPEDGSAIRARVIAAFDCHRVIRHLSDEDAAATIRDDEIDILVDLNGLTSGSRIQILRYRPAPVQATYLGFIGPIPIPEIDFLLCDDFVIPPSQVKTYQPKPLSIASVYQANDSERELGLPLARGDVGLPADRFVFCCFSNHYKITEAMFSTWMLILRQTPSSVLWLSQDNEHSRQNLRHAARGANVDESRILFAARTDPGTYMQRLALADLFLDTFPYNAGTIASDAIRMQLPMVTMSGESFASRMAGSLLRAIGADAGMTTSAEDYVAACVRLATSNEDYGAYKALFTEKAWRSTIGDMGRFTKQYESALSAECKRPIAPT